VQRFLVDRAVQRPEHRGHDGFDQREHRQYLTYTGAEQKSSCQTRNIRKPVAPFRADRPSLGAGGSTRNVRIRRHVTQPHVRPADSIGRFSYARILNTMEENVFVARKRNEFRIRFVRLRRPFHATLRSPSPGHYHAKSADE